MRIEKWIFASLVAVLVPAAAWADGEGLAARADAITWGGRTTQALQDTLTTDWRATLLPPMPGGLRVQSFNVLGDLYVGSSAAGLRAPPSGFRATSGLLVGLRSQPWGASPLASAGSTPADRRLAGAAALPYSSAEAASENATVPYLGFGYSALSAKSGWSFSADLGVMSLNPGSALRIGRSASGQGLDDLVRDMRLSPVLQLGVAYSF